MFATLECLLFLSFFGLSFAPVIQN